MSRPKDSQGRLLPKTSSQEFITCSSQSKEIDQELEAPSSPVKQETELPFLEFLDQSPKGSGTFRRKLITQDPFRVSFDSQLSIQPPTLDFSPSLRPTTYHINWEENTENIFKMEGEAEREPDRTFTYPIQLGDDDS